MTTVFESDRIKIEVNSGWQVVITDKVEKGAKITVSADGAGLYAESESCYSRADQHDDGTAALRVTGEGG